MMPCLASIAAWAWLAAMSWRKRCRSKSTGALMSSMTASGLWRKRAPHLAFRDAQGSEHRLAEWRGRTVLLNLWATWCVPCRKEMPALDALEGKLGGPAFEVVAVNIDTRDPEKPRTWLKEVGVGRLGYYADPSAKVFQDLKTVGRAAGMPP